MMLQPGQKLYLFQMDSRRRDVPPREVVVEKIGRKWATLVGGLRVDMESLWVDHGQYTSDERCYLSVEQRQNERDLSAEWSRFQRAVERTFGTSPTTNIERIREAAALLGLAPPARS